MHLRSLTLQAIGPFAGRHTIDFDALAQGGLFLLEGPTGSGKSTVIDAIVFALYGKVASAEASEDRLRSAYAADDVESVVDLVFEVPSGRLPGAAHARLPARQAPRQRDDARERVGQGVAAARRTPTSTATRRRRRPARATGWTRSAPRSSGSSGSTGRSSCRRSCCRRASSRTSCAPSPRTARTCCRRSSAPRCTSGCRSGWPRCAARATAGPTRPGPRCGRRAAQLVGAARLTPEEGAAVRVRGRGRDRVDDARAVRRPTSWRATTAALDALRRLGAGGGRPDAEASWLEAPQLLDEARRGGGPAGDAGTGCGRAGPSSRRRRT